jgi:hypothetical protein
MLEIKTFMKYSVICISLSTSQSTHRKESIEMEACCSYFFSRHGFFKKHTHSIKEAILKSCSQYRKNLPSVWNKRAPQLSLFFNLGDILRQLLAEYLLLYELVLTTYSNFARGH